MDEFADHFAAIFCSELENEGRSLVMSNGPGRVGISGTARSALRVPVSDPALVIGLAAPGSTYGVQIPLCARNGKRGTTGTRQRPQAVESDILAGLSL